VTRVFATTLAAVLVAGSACAGRPPALRRPSMLLVTLDTTRADAMGPEAADVATPAFTAIAATGRRFVQAYATAPETLPSHASMMTGLYPAGHGVHENARVLSPTHEVLAERLASAGYSTAAFVSSIVLTRQYGLARGFAHYDDAIAPGAVERSARETTERAIRWLAASNGGPAPVFLWVHYFEPHAPYAPPQPFAAAHADRPYLGEIAAMDAELGRLVASFRDGAGRDGGVIVTGDHGEGLGDHGEAAHGLLLYQSTMRVPLVVAGPGVSPAVVDRPVSVRQVFHTILDWAGQPGGSSLRGERRDVVLGEAMKPFLEYGWQPQVMAVGGRLKAIRAGRTEVYDVIADPAETADRYADTAFVTAVPPALGDYPIPSPAAARPAIVGEADRQALASLGYVSGGAAPVVRKDAPRPADMTALFPDLDRASTLFVRARYREVVPLLERILQRDPGNLDAVLRLATSHSLLGQDAAAGAAFRRAEALAPGSLDVRLYLALHHARRASWPMALPLVEAVVAAEPDRVPALEALADLRERQGRAADATALLERVHRLRPATPPELVRLGLLAMAAGDTARGLRAFEAARERLGPRFTHDLELGVLYLEARRLAEARDALSRVAPGHAGYPMALFKRAQVSVLLNEPDQADRIAAARRHADRTTAPLIAAERLFRQ
jgi:arylsulfatase A-like enzyme